MTLTIDFLPEARREFDKAADRYEAQSSGLGTDFVTAVDRVLLRISTQPNFYATVWRNVREGLVSRFPFVVYYREEATRILVLSVFHTSRNPLIWKRRARR